MRNTRRPSSRKESTSARISASHEIADFDGNKIDDFKQGLDFNTLSSAFDQYKPNAPKLSVENGTYFVTVGTLKMPVTFTLAGQPNGSAQRFTVIP